MTLAIFDKTSGQAKSIIPKKTGKLTKKEKEFVKINEADVEIEFDPSESKSKHGIESSRYRNTNGVDFTYSKRPYTAILSERIQPHRRSARAPPRVLGPVKERPGAPPQYLDITLSSAQIIYHTPVQPSKSPSQGRNQSQGQSQSQQRPRSGTQPLPHRTVQAPATPAQPPDKPIGAKLPSKASAPPGLRPASRSRSPPRSAQQPRMQHGPPSHPQTHHLYSRYTPYSREPEFPIENQPYHSRRNIIKDTLISRSNPSRQPPSIITDTLSRSDPNQPRTQIDEQTPILEDEIAELFNTDIVVEKAGQQQPKEVTGPQTRRGPMPHNTIRGSKRPELDVGLETEEPELTQEGIRALRDGYMERRARAHRLKSKQKRELDEIFK